MANPKLYTTRDIATNAGVSLRTVQRACKKAGITRRPLVILGEAEKKSVIAAIVGKVGNPEFSEKYTRLKPPTPPSSDFDDLPKCD